MKPLVIELTVIVTLKGVNGKNELGFGHLVKLDKVRKYLRF